MATMKIRHKILATRGLESPIKFTVLPRVDLIFNEKGIVEVDEKIGEKLLKEPGIYELVVEPPKVIEEPPKVEASPKVPTKRVPKIEPKVEDGEAKAKAEFAKQITE